MKKQKIKKTKKRIAFSIAILFLLVAGYIIIYRYSIFIENGNSSLASTKPFLTISAPNGGEKLKAGQAYTIKWKSKQVKTVSIALLYGANGATGWVPSGTMEWLAYNVPNTGSYVWNISKGFSGNQNYKIQILGVGTTLSDESDGYFTIVKK